MPDLDGTGPYGAGTGTGRGFGRCGNDAYRAAGRGGKGGFDRSRGRGQGWGCGFGARRGLGRGLGWFAVGYDAPGRGDAADIRSTLEARAAHLREELERTEALLNAPRSAENEAGGGEA